MVTDSTTHQFGMSYFGYASSQFSDNSTGAASIYTFHLVSLNYRLTPQTSVGLSPAFIYESQGQRYGSQMPAETRMSDLSVDMIHRNPIFLPFEIKSKAVYRFIFPTDPIARKVDTHFGLGAKFEFSRDLSSALSLGYIPKVTYFISPTKLGELEQWLSLTYFFGDRISISQGVGMKDVLYNTSSANRDQHVQSQLIQTLLNVNVGEHMTVSMGLGQERSASTAWSLYREEESAYLLMASVWM